MLRGGAFARSGVITRIDTVDPDQVAGQSCDLLLRGKAHPDIVPPGVVGPRWRLRLGRGARRDWVAGQRNRPRRPPSPSARRVLASRFAIVRRPERFTAAAGMSGWRNRQTR